MWRTNPLALFTIALLFISTNGVAQDYRYAVIELPRLTDTYQWAGAGGVNSAGDAVGFTSTADFAIHAVLWPRDGGVVDLGTLGGRYSGALEINDSGEICGWAVAEPNGSILDTRAFLWRDGQMIDLGTLGGEDSYAYDLDDSSRVVGLSEHSEGPGEQGFVWENGQMTALPNPYPGRNASHAFGTNNRDEVIGKGLNLDGIQRAMLWIDRQPVDLGSLIDEGSVAYAINESGVIVGRSDAPFGYHHAVKWVDHQIIDIHTNSIGPRSTAWGINNIGQIVGEYSGPLDPHAFVLDPGENVLLLDDLVPPRLRLDWNIESARDINDAGQIPVTAGFDGNSWALLLTPVSPTMTLQGPQPGSAGTRNGLRVTGATPGATVTFLYSRHGGGTRIPDCDLQENALQLDNPKIIGSAVADQNGTASITRTVPLVARGQTILFQAVVQNECAVSQLVVHEFQ